MINGKIDWKKGTLSVGLGAVVAAMGAAYINISNQTATAIDIARQHGEELLLLRREMQRLEGVIDAHMGDRFRGEDWDAAQKWLEVQFRSIEKEHADFKRRLNSLERSDP